MPHGTALSQAVNPTRYYSRLVLALTRQSARQLNPRYKPGAQREGRVSVIILRKALRSRESEFRETC